MEKINIFNGIYRGVVVSNYDPEVKGRCKIWVPSVYPEVFKDQPDNLPWAEPVMSLFGGSFTNNRKNDLNKETGVTTIPHEGAEVWLFFENGNHLYPKFFGACQGGSGWHSEHRNQHVIKTDNITIRIDEYFDKDDEMQLNENEKTTCYCDSNNSKCTGLSKDQSIKKMPTRLDINIINDENPKDNKDYNRQRCAVNLNIIGNVNIKVKGNVFEEINGNKHETLIGNKFVQHNGDLHYVHNGRVLYEHNGDYLETVKGDKTIVIDGNFEKSVNKKYTLNCFNDRLETTTQMYILNTYGSKTENIADQHILTISGGEIKNVSGDKLEIVTGDSINTAVENHVIVGGLGSHRYVFTGMIIDKAANLYRKGSLFIVDETAGQIHHNYNPVYTPLPEGGVVL